MLGACRYATCMQCYIVNSADFGHPFQARCMKANQPADVTRAGYTEGTMLHICMGRCGASCSLRTLLHFHTEPIRG